MRSHGHDAHAVGEASVNRLKALVVEGLGEQHSGDGFDQLRIGDGTIGFFVCGDAGVGVFRSFAAEAEDEVRDGLAKSCVLLGIRGLQGF